MQAIVDISKALSIGGWMSRRELLWLASEAQECNKIVEFGSFHGRSTRALGDNIKEDGKVWAVDPWNGDYPDESGTALGEINTYVYPYFRANLLDLITVGRVIPIRGFSFSFYLPFQVDMVFIDGDHRYETVLRDIDRACGLAKSGGIVCGHDYGHPLWPGVKKAVDEKFGDVGIEETIWWKIRS